MTKSVNILFPRCVEKPQLTYTVPPLSMHMASSACDCLSDPEMPRELDKSRDKIALRDWPIVSVVDRCIDLTNAEIQYP